MLSPVHYKSQHSKPWQQDFCKWSLCSIMAAPGWWRCVSSQSPITDRTMGWRSMMTLSWGVAGIRSIQTAGAGEAHSSSLGLYPKSHRTSQNTATSCISYSGLEMRTNTFIQTIIYNSVRETHGTTIMLGLAMTAPKMSQNEAMSRRQSLS